MRIIRTLTSIQHVQLKNISTQIIQITSQRESDSNSISSAHSIFMLNETDSLNISIDREPERQKDRYSCTYADTNSNISYLHKLINVFYLFYRIRALLIFFTDLSLFHFSLPMVLVDDHSMYTWVNFLKDKSKASSKFIKFNNIIKNEIWKQN